jgi:hypothetical protein
MKRFHVHICVDDLNDSIRFYSTLFATSLTIEKPDYAKWMLDNLRINFAIVFRSLLQRLIMEHIHVRTSQN